MSLTIINWRLTVPHKVLKDKFILKINFNVLEKL